MADISQITSKVTKERATAMPSSTLHYASSPPRTTVDGGTLTFTMLVDGATGRQACPVCREAITSWPLPVTLNEDGALSFETAPARGVGATMGTVCHACNTLVHRTSCISKPGSRGPMPGVDPDAWLCHDCLQELIGLGG